MADIYLKATQALVWLDNRAMKYSDHDVERNKDRIYTSGEKCIRSFWKFGQWALHTPTYINTDLMKEDY
jgi:hypothetical protein